MPEIHPQISDRIESERCPKCGEPGLQIDDLGFGLQVWACPTCEPGEFQGGA